MKKAVLIDTYLTIPYATNYEINGRYQVRNKKTGRFKKPSKHTGRRTVRLCCNGNVISRSVAQAYQAALDYYLGEYDGSQWATCAMLQGLYEMNYNGELRNARNKHKLVLNHKNYYTLTINGKTTSYSQKKLMREIFEIPFKKAKNASRTLILKKDSFAKYFPSFSAAARWLSPKVHYTVSWIIQKFVKRPSEIFGWQVQYLGR